MTSAINFSLISKMTMIDLTKARKALGAAVAEINERLESVVEVLRGDVEDWMWLGNISDNVVGPVEQEFDATDRKSAATRYANKRAGIVAEYHESAAALAELTAEFHAWADSVIAAHQPAAADAAAAVDEPAYAIYDDAAVYAVAATIDAAIAAALDDGAFERQAPALVAWRNAVRGDLADMTAAGKLSADDEVCNGCAKARRCTPALAARVASRGGNVGRIVREDGVLDIDD